MPAEAEALALAYEHLQRVLEDLREAKALGAAARRAKDEFLANVSHEIRTPMNAMLGMTELVLEGELAPDQRQWLQSAKGAGESLLVIIDDLLDFSKIDSGSFVLRPTTFRVRHELADALRDFEVRARRKGLLFSSTVAPDVPEDLVGDAGRWRQIVTNLVANAVKFTAVGEISVALRVVAPRPDGIELALDVRDTGIGIPEDQRTAIFAAFAQEDTSTTRSYGGTGLGLTIAARLAGLMDGAITVQSVVDQGSTFTCHVRFGVAPAAAKPWSSTTTGAARSRPLKVLVAEDNELNARLMRELLIRRGHEARIATNGLEALEMIMDDDLLLLDLHMPGLDGYEVIARIRERERATGGHLAVVAVTASSRQEDRERCLAAGMDDFIAKPINGTSLGATIARVIANRLEWIDAEVVLAACDGDAAIYDQIRSGLQVAVPKEIAAATAHLANGDASALRETAHRLHGIIGAVSTRVALVASDLEDQAAAGAWDHARSLVALLEEQSPALLAELARMPFSSLARWSA